MENCGMGVNNLHTEATGKSGETVQSEVLSPPCPLSLGDTFS